MDGVSFMGGWELIGKNFGLGLEDDMVKARMFVVVDEDSILQRWRSMSLLMFVCLYKGEWKP